MELKKLQERCVSPTAILFKEGKCQGCNLDDLNILFSEQVQRLKEKLLFFIAVPNVFIKNWIMFLIMFLLFAASVNLHFNIFSQAGF